MAPDAPTPDPSPATPVERWGTCCPHDPECEHSFLDHDELERRMDTPITDTEAADWEKPRMTAPDTFVPFPVELEIDRA